jgi:multidrug efflux pump
MPVNLFAPLIRRPIGTSLLALGLALAGLWAYLLLGVAALPSIEFPGMVVYTEVPGANAQTMASTVAAPLERHLGRIPGIKEMHSESNDGSTSIRILFNFGNNTDKLARDVQAAINASLVDLPSSMTVPPRYYKFNTANIPVLLLSLTSETLPPDKLYDLADSLINPALAQIPGVAQVRVIGGRPRAVRVELNTVALAAKGLTANDVANALRAANVTSPEGTLSDGRTQMTVTANDSLHNPEEFANLLIAINKNGAQVRLSDVARVVSGQQDEYQAAWFNNHRSVAIRVAKRPEANAVATADAVRAKLPQMRAWLPADIQITPIFDLTQTTKSALHEVMVALMLSVLMVALVMLVFLRRIGPMLIAMLSVPLSLAGAFTVMWILGYTLNTLSLIALVLCIGFVVDDAIVVIENIVRHMEHGEPPLQAATMGVKEIGFTVVSITLSLIAVFAPLLFGNNQFTLLLREFSVTLTAAVVISAIVSLSVTPALCGRFLPVEEPGARTPGRLERSIERFDRGMQRIYERALDWAMRHRRLMRWQPIILLALTVVMATGVVKLFGFNFMPPEDIGMIQGDVRADANISPTLMAERAMRASAIMKADPAVLDVTTFLGSDNAGGAVGNQATMFVDLKPRGSGPGQRSEPVKDIIARLSKAYEKLPELRVSLNSIGFFNDNNDSSRGSQSFELISSNNIDLQPWALQVAQLMRKRKEFHDVTTDYDSIDKQQMLKVDRAAASRLQVNMGLIDSALYNAFGQNQVSIIYSDINQYWVVLTSSAEHTIGLASLLNTYVRSEQGSMVPLSAVAHIEPNVSPSLVIHTNQLEATQIYYNTEQNMPQDKAMALIEQIVAEARLPAGIQLGYSGGNQQLQETRSNANVLLIGSILAMYIVLGILYESLGHPLTILSTLPAAGAGAFLAMLATGMSLSLMAIIAILMLIGIVKKNAILMVDFALVAQREHGLSPPEAIRQAALVRFRPITMTTLVAMGAALPLAIGFGIGSEMRQPLGVAIVGGLLVSQLLTLLSTPAIYLWNHDRKERKAARKARREARRSLAGELDAAG